MNILEAKFAVLDNITCLTRGTIMTSEYLEIINSIKTSLKALEILKTIFKIELGISFANTSYTKYHLKLTNRLDNNHFIVINISKEHYDLLKKELEK